jgi:hypothetical protein
LVSCMERASSLSWLFTSVNSMTARDHIKVNVNVKCKLHTVIIVPPHSGTSLRPPTRYKFRKLIIPRLAQGRVLHAVTFRRL